MDTHELTRAPEQHAALTRLASAARAYVADARAPRTIEAYRAQWAHFRAFCEAHGVEALPAEPAIVALYLTARAQEGRRVATLAQALSAISQAHKLAGLASPRTSPVVCETFQGIRRRHGSAPAQKAPLLGTQLHALLAVLHDPLSLLALRDRALLLVGFAGAFRRAELVALEVEDLRFGPAGVTVRVRRAKTDQEGRGRDLGLPFGSQPAHCPVRTLQRWLTLASIGSGPVFRSVDRHGNVRGALSGRDVARIVKRTAVAAGLDPRPLSGHSLRAGLATSAAHAGKSVHAIMKTTGHRSVAMVHKYIREADLFRDNAVDGLL